MKLRCLELRHLTLLRCNFIEKEPWITLVKNHIGLSLFHIQSSHKSTQVDYSILRECTVSFPTIQSLWLGNCRGLVVETMCEYFRENKKVCDELGDTPQIHTLTIDGWTVNEQREFLHFLRNNPTLIPKLITVRMDDNLYLKPFDHNPKIIWSSFSETWQHVVSLLPSLDGFN